MNRDAIASFLEAEVKCYHCGHSSGILRRQRGVPNAPTVFLGKQDSPPIAVRNLTALRCSRCRGSVYTDEFDVRYLYPKVDFLADQPRRGRPPKKLVELRRAEQAALKSA